jgi:hypothetical protein
MSLRALMIFALYELFANRIYHESSLVRHQSTVKAGPDQVHVELHGVNGDASGFLENKECEN